MVLEGKKVHGGIAIGKLYIYKKEKEPVKCYKVSDTKAEEIRFWEAKEKAKEQLDVLYEKALREIGKEKAAIFEGYRMLLEDTEYIDSVRNIIHTQAVNAEYAVAAVGDNLAVMFSAMEDAYMKEKATDIKDVCTRVINCLSDSREATDQPTDKVILLAENLTPSELFSFDKSKLLAIVTKDGSTISHTAILAGNMNIPVLTGVQFDNTTEGKIGIVDGSLGKMIVEATEEELKEYGEKMEEEENKKQLLRKQKGRKTITRDGKQIPLYANIARVSEVADALENDAEGIGLFRSEYLYSESENYPDETKLFQIYKTVAENMAGRKVIIRTLDSYLDREEIFKTQLRAIYRASDYGNVSILFPMIVSLEEVQKIKAMLKEVKTELDKEKISYSDCEIGIMIETPAAVMISDLLADEVDFFSIGTNDLTRYTLAVDRENVKLDTVYNLHHEAIIRMLKLVIENGHKAGCRVEICGELASDLSFTETLIQMGVDELSVSPSKVLSVRETINTI